MTGIDFLFVFFIFLLLCAFLFLARHVFKSMNKPEDFNREVNWVKRYQELQNMADGMEAYVDEIQEELRQEKAEMRRIAARVEETYRKLSGGADIDAPVIVTLNQQARRPRPGVFPPEAVTGPPPEVYVPPEEAAPEEVTFEPPDEAIFEPPVEIAYEPPQTFAQPEAAYEPSDEAVFEPPVEIAYEPPQAFAQSEAAYEPPEEAIFEPPAEIAYEPPQAFAQPEAEYEPPDEAIFEPPAEIAYEPPQAFAQPEAEYAPPEEAYAEETAPPEVYESAIPPDLEELLEELAEIEEPQMQEESFTLHERILALRAQGYGDGEIAQRLSITRSEVALTIEFWEKSGTDE